MNQETNWDNIYWKLKLHYPNEEQFDEHNFGYCPIYIVEEALSAIEENNIEQANLLAIPIAKASVAMLSSQGAKQAQEEWFNPYQKILDIRKAKEYISEDAARTFLELYKVNCIPNWVMSVLSNDEIELIKNAGL